MSRDDLIDRSTEVLREIAQLEAEKDLLLKKLLETGAQPGDLLVSSMGHKLRICDRGVLREDLLEESVSRSVWNRITVRKSKAALVTIAIQKGLLASTLVDKCYRRSRPWMEIR